MLPLSLFLSLSISIPLLTFSSFFQIGAALVGGPGVVPGANVGREYALFEPGCRHVAKDIAGQNVANPTAMLLSASLMLKHLALDNQANRISGAVHQVIQEGKVRTGDMGGKASTEEYTKAVLAAAGAA